MCWACRQPPLPLDDASRRAPSLTHSLAHQLAPGADGDVPSDLAVAGAAALAHQRRQPHVGGGRQACRLTRCSAAGEGAGTAVTVQRIRRGEAAAGRRGSWAGLSLHNRLAVHWPGMLSKPPTQKSGEACVGRGRARQADRTQAGRQGELGRRRGVRPPPAGTAAAKPPVARRHLRAGLVHQHICLGGRQPELRAGRERSGGSGAARGGRRPESQAPARRRQAVSSTGAAASLPRYRPRAGAHRNKQASKQSAAAARLVDALVGRHEAGGRLLAAPLEHVPLVQAQRGGQLARGAGPVRLQARVQAHPARSKVGRGEADEARASKSGWRAVGGWRLAGMRPPGQPALEAFPLTCLQCR